MGRNLPCLNLIEILNNELDKKSITWKNDELLGKFKSKNSLNTLTITNNYNYKIKIKKIKDIIYFATRIIIKCISKKTYFLGKINTSYLSYVNAKKSIQTQRVVFPNLQLKHDLRRLNIQNNPLIKEIEGSIDSRIVSQLLAIYLGPRISRCSTQHITKIWRNVIKENKICMNKTKKLPMHKKDVYTARWFKAITILEISAY